MKSTCLPLVVTAFTVDAFTSSRPNTRKSNLHSTQVPAKNTPEWDVKQHLYGLDMIENDNSVTLNSDGEIEEKSLPLPETYVTCGKCKCLFAIAESDLGAQGKGWWVAVSVLLRAVMCWSPLQIRMRVCFIWCHTKCRCWPLSRFLVFFQLEARMNLCFLCQRIFWPICCLIFIRRLIHVHSKESNWSHQMVTNLLH